MVISVLRCAASGRTGKSWVCLIIVFCFFFHCTRKATVNVLQVFLVEMSRCKKCGCAGFIHFVSASIVCRLAIIYCHLFITVHLQPSPSTGGKTCDTGSVSLCKPRFIILHCDYAEAYCALFELDCGFHCASVDELLPSQKGQISGHCIYMCV